MILSERAFSRLLERLKLQKVEQISSEELISSYPDVSLQLVENLYKGKVLFKTKHGSLGFGHLLSSLDHLVCVLKGFKPPIILRKVDTCYVLVGRCFSLALVAQPVGDGKARYKRLEVH